MDNVQTCTTTMNTETRLSDKQLVPNSSQERKIVGWSLCLAGFLLVADQLTKIMVIHHFVSPGSKTIEIIPGFFNLVYVHNNGAAWNMLAGKTWLLLALGIVVFTLIIRYFRYLTEGWTERYFAMFMAISGIIGNSADRVWNGGNVIDFLDCYISDSHWPAFNVADSAICVAAAVYIISMQFRPEPEKKATASED